MEIDSNRSQLGRGPSIQKVCAICETPFFVYPYEAATAKVCSPHCRNLLITTHGHARRTAGGKPTSTWLAWHSMKERCLNPRATGYKHWGGRGITVCARWLNSFENFLADMGERPDGLSMERNDNNGNYEPGNCRWATRAEQARNKRSNRNLTVDGVTHCVTEWAEIVSIPRHVIYLRLGRGWDAKTAVFTKVGEITRWTQ